MTANDKSNHGQKMEQLRLKAVMLEYPHEAEALIKESREYLGENNPEFDAFMKYAIEQYKNFLRVACMGNISADRLEDSQVVQLYRQALPSQDMAIDVAHPGRATVGNPAARPARGESLDA